MKKLFVSSSIIMALVMMFSLVTSAATAFKDIPTSYYAHTEISDLVNRGVIKGFADNTFKPAKQVTRAEFATFVARALELPAASSNFKDVPKNSSLYDGVSRAAKAGIIKGFADGNFKGTLPVTREDMAVMIDRALQKKGSFTKTKSLNFSDSAKIGGYAKLAVQRLYYYGIMEAYTGTKFDGKVAGTRAETARFLYRFINVIEDGQKEQPSNLAVEEIKRKNPLDMTLAEIKKAYGEETIVERWDQFGKVEGIKTRDVWKQYYDQIHAVNWKKLNREPIKPDIWLQEAKDTWMKSLIGEYVSNYPKYEIISINGVPFMQSFLMTPEAERFLAREIDVFPKPPTESNKFKIDIHLNKVDFATYFNRKAEVGKLQEASYTKEGKALMVDLNSAFEDVPEVELTSTTASYKGNTIQFKIGSNQILVNGNAQSLSVPIENKNNRLMVPIREFSKALGLYTRVTTVKVSRLEITNYEEPLGEYYK